MTDSRYLRHWLLKEIGQAGQTRLASASAPVIGSGLAHEVAERYARAAGFGDLAAGVIDVDAGEPRELVRDDAARQVLAGSRATIQAIRAALNLNKGPGVPLS